MTYAIWHRGLGRYFLRPNKEKTRAEVLYFDTREEADKYFSDFLMSNPVYEVQAIYE